MKRTITSGIFYTLSIIALGQIPETITLGKTTRAQIELIEDVSCSDTGEWGDELNSDNGACGSYNILQEYEVRLKQGLVVSVSYSAFQWHTIPDKWSNNGLFFATALDGFDAGVRIDEPGSDFDQVKTTLNELNIKYNIETTDYSHYLSFVDDGLKCTFSIYKEEGLVGISVRKAD